MRKGGWVVAIGLLMWIGLTGCGETIRGIGRDASRIAYGAKTIFVSQR